MRQILIVGGIALGLYGLYLVRNKKGGGGCSKKGHRDMARSYVQQARGSMSGVRGNGVYRGPNQPVIPDDVRQVYDASPVATCCPSVAFPNFMYPDDLQSSDAAAIVNS